MFGLTWTFFCQRNKNELDELLIIVAVFKNIYSLLFSMKCPKQPKSRSKSKKLSQKLNEMAICKWQFKTQQVQRHFEDQKMLFHVWTSLDCIYSLSANKIAPLYMEESHKSVQDLLGASTGLFANYGPAHALWLVEWGWLSYFTISAEPIQWLCLLSLPLLGLLDSQLASCYCIYAV